MPLELNTFSLAARCDRTGMLGVVVATAMPAVGSNCPWAAAAVGAVATQAWVNPYLGIDGLEALRTGADAAKALDTVLAHDPEYQRRQVGIVDSNGGSAAHTGDSCAEWAGHITGPGFAAQGNMLTGPQVVQTLADSYLAQPTADLPERLMTALEAASAAGGDRRGKQSAALYVVDREQFPSVDLRVDEHKSPVRELRRILEIARRQLFPFTETFATRERPGGRYDAAVARDTSLRPSQRP